MKTFNLKIYACEKIFYEGECEILVFNTADGEMGILANHEGLTAINEIGEMRFRVPGETEYRRCITSDGIVKVDKNNVNVIVYSAEKPEDIDTFRAQAALERAREQMSHKQSIMEYNVSAASMARAMARLRAVHKK